MATKKTLIIEGSSDATNGDLRQGFDKLFSKKMDQNKPKIIPKSSLAMGNPRQ